MFKALWKKKFVIITLALLVAFLPMAMTKEATVLGKTIVTAIGIDKQNDEYAVFIESMIFNFDPFGVPERELTSATAPTIDAALEEIGMNMGRKISFSHCSIILLGSGLVDEDLVELLFPFLKKPQLSNGAVMMYTDDDVEEVMRISEETGDVRSAKLQQIAAFNKNRTNQRIATTLEEFFRNSKGRDGRARLSVIEIEDEALVNSDRVVELEFGIVTNSNGGD